MEDRQTKLNKVRIIKETFGWKNKQLAEMLNSSEASIKNALAPSSKDNLPKWVDAMISVFEAVVFKKPFPQPNFPAGGVIHTNQGGEYLPPVACKGDCGGCVSFAKMPLSPMPTQEEADVENVCHVMKVDRKTAAEVIGRMKLIDLSPAAAMQFFERTGRLPEEQEVKDAIKGNLENDPIRCGWCDWQGGRSDCNIGCVVNKGDPNWFMCPNCGTTV